MIKRIKQDSEEEFWDCQETEKPLSEGLKACGFRIFKTAVHQVYFVSLMVPKTSQIEVL